MLHQCCTKSKNAQNKKCCKSLTYNTLLSENLALNSTQSRNSTGFNIVKQSFVFSLNINTLQECCILLFFTF